MSDADSDDFSSLGQPHAFSLPADAVVPSALVEPLALAVPAPVADEGAIVALDKKVVAAPEKRKRAPLGVAGISRNRSDAERKLVIERARAIKLLKKKESASASMTAVVQNILETNGRIIRGTVLDRRRGKTAIEKRETAQAISSLAKFASGRGPKRLQTNGIQGLPSCI